MQQSLTTFISDIYFAGHYYCVTMKARQSKLHSVDVVDAVTKCPVTFILDDEKFCKCVERRFRQIADAIS